MHSPDSPEFVALKRGGGVAARSARAAGADAAHWRFFDSQICISSKMFLRLRRVKSPTSKHSRTRQFARRSASQNAIFSYAFVHLKTEPKCRPIRKHAAIPNPS